MVALLIALCAGIYARTVDFPMVFDDHIYLKDNPIFKDAGSFTYPAHFVEFARRPARMGIDPDMATNFILRPVAYASFRLNYTLDGFNPRWFRVLNILIHAGNSILIYALLRLLLGRSPQSGALPRGSAFCIPATAALLFAAHPLATESVTYITQRFTSMSTLFYLLTLGLYFASLHATSRSGRRMLRTLAVALVMLGMLTKECVFTAPLMAVMIDSLVNGTRLRTAVARALPLLLCLPIVPVLVILTSVAQHDGEFSLANAFNIVNSRDDPLDHWHYLVTQVTVVTAYLQRIFWPTGLNIDPEWPLYRSLVETPVLIAAAVLGALTASAWWIWRSRPTDARSSIVFVFTLWFFVTVSVSSGLVPLPDLMADHRSYLPSIGIFTLVACLFDVLRNSRWQPAVARTLAPATAVLCLGALAWASHARNEVWRSNVTLWEDTVAKSPGKYRPWGNLGVAYSNSGRDEDAVKCYNAALKIEPKFQTGRLNLSNSLLRLNRPKDSLDNTIKTIQIDRTALSNPRVILLLGCGLAGVARYDEAIAVLKDLIAAVPDDPEAHKALGLIYRHIDRPRLAMEHLQRAEKLQNPDARLWRARKDSDSSLKNVASNP